MQLRKKRNTAEAAIPRIRLLRQSQRRHPRARARVTLMLTEPGSLVVASRTVAASSNHGASRTVTCEASSQSLGTTVRQTAQRGKARVKARAKVALPRPTPGLLTVLASLAGTSTKVPADSVIAAHTSTVRRQQMPLRPPITPRRKPKQKRYVTRRPVRAGLALALQLLSEAW